MTKKPTRRSTSLYALLLVGGAACADPTYHINIRSATLDAALKEFASQTGLQVAYFTKIASGRMAPAVSGTLTAEQALQSLLGASGLRYERIDESTVAIHGAPSSAAMPEGTSAGGSADAGHYSMRLARADSQAPAVQSAQGGAQPEGERDLAILSEVVVTGSHIRGVVNETVPIMSFDREYIQRSGYSNMMQLVESLPVHFKGGVSGSSEVAPFGLAPNYGQNLTRGTGFNLRGLGSVSTLTLINGRRVAPSAHGQFVDVSTIPLSAVERVEILTDGASAIYGADAVAGVVNIILRKDFDGAETGLHYGAAGDGALDEQRLSQTFGSSWESGNALLVGELYKRSELDVADRDFIVEAGGVGPTYLLPKRKVGSFVFNLEQALPGNFDFSSNALYSYEEVDQASTTGDSTLLVTQSPVSQKWSASAGLGYTPFTDWRFAIDGTIARTRTDTDFTYLDVPSQQVVLLIRDYRDKFDTWSLDLKGDGTLFSLPGGPVRLAIGTSFREDDVHSTRYRVIPPTGYEVRAIDSREVTSAFAELYVPIVGEHQNVSFARRIEVSLAGRYDDYSDFGDTTNPKVGIVWSPIDSLDLRASFSTSFRAPTVAEKALSRRGQQISTGVVSAANGIDIAPIFYLIGSAPLTAEESDNLAFGFTFRPEALPGASLTVNYFDIDYTDRIASPPFDDGILQRRDEFGELITEIASDAAAQAYLDALLAQDWLFIDWEGTGAAGVRHVYDARQKNAARTRTSGFDVTASYAFVAGPTDSFDFSLNVTHLKEILTSLTSTTTTFDQVDTYNQPLDWRARLMGSWLHGGFNTTVVVSHADDYINDSFLIDEPIGSWTTVDVTVSYDFTGRTRSALLDGSKVAVGISNLLDREPPHADSPRFAIGYDAFNADPMGRFISARFTRRW